MKAVVQRVTRAQVEVAGQIVGRIRDGLLVLLGVAVGDTDAAGRTMAEKLHALRIFPDDRGKMNRSLTDTGGSVLVVSQFTLLGNTKNGRRPSFEAAAPPAEAKRLYEFVIHELRARGIGRDRGVRRPYGRRFGQRRAREVRARDVSGEIMIAEMEPACKAKRVRKAVTLLY